MIKHSKRGMTEPEVVQMLGKEDAREVHRNAESPDDLSLTYVAQHFGLALSKQFEIAYKPFPKIAICHQCSEQEIL